MSCPRRSIDGALDLEHFAAIGERPSFIAGEASRDVPLDCRSRTEDNSSPFLSFDHLAFERRACQHLVLTCAVVLLPSNG